MDILGLTLRVYLRHQNHSGLVLFDPEIKNMYFTLFRLSFMSEMVPNFSNFLHILKIAPELLVITLGDIVSVSKAKNYSGINLFHPEFKNKCFTLF